MRLGQLDPAQYGSTQQYNTWAYSACSSASMTEVMNAYGHKYRITDILTVEARIHEITPELGLLEESGIQHTGEQFGFKTTWGHNLSLDQVIAAANHGTPVIVSFPPAKYAGGHILVVRGGNASTVYLADSSRLNWTQLTRARFMQLWGGFSAIMTPK
jgi:ABC-type bacteriocin/lantibiotic exporter with double-glycine peptidase domain